MLLQALLLIHHKGLMALSILLTAQQCYSTLEVLRDDRHHANWLLEHCCDQQLIGTELNHYYQPRKNQHVTLILLIEK